MWPCHSCAWEGRVVWGRRYVNAESYKLDIQRNSESKGQGYRSRMPNYQHRMKVVIHSTCKCVVWVAAACFALIFPAI